MLAVCFHIGKVIENINTGRDQTKQHKACESSQERIDIEELFVKYKCGKDEDIFRTIAAGAWFLRGLLACVYFT